MDPTISGSHRNGVMENGSAKRVKMSHSSIFDGLPMCPPDPIFFVKDSYNADKDPKKVNLGIGGTCTYMGYPGLEIISMATHYGPHDDRGCGHVIIWYGIL